MHLQDHTTILPTPDDTSHLSKHNWEKTNSLLVSKILSEFSHEGITVPEPVETPKNGYQVYRLILGDGSICYSFGARILAMNHWSIRPETIKKTELKAPAALDAMQLVIELKDFVSQDVFPSYLEESASTLHAMAYTYHYGKPNSSALVSASYQELEGAMTGHPRFIASNGRIGFDLDDYRQYAPETASPFPLCWLAGHKEKAVFTAISTLDYQQVLSQETDVSLRDKWDNYLVEKDLDPKDYYYFPVHPWQWNNVLTLQFAGDISVQNLVYLGPGDDHYLPQQSIRTFYNFSEPDRFYVKTAVGLLNMGYVRGLSPRFMQSNPGINEWLQAMLHKDRYLRGLNFIILREVASISFEHSQFEAALENDSHYKKMLACLWRESPAPHLKTGQNLMTMAALLHSDQQGVPLLPELIRASGISPIKWVKSYLRCYLQPLLHCFYQYDMVFMPHGENLILIMENHVPVKAIMKDIGEEVSLFTPSYEVPDVAQRLVVCLDGQERTLPIFTQLFDSIFRFISGLLEESNTLAEEDFWKEVAQSIKEYQNLHPELTEKFAAYDLFAQHFEPDALNKLQLSNNRKLRDRSKPFTGLPTVGRLKNPISKFSNNSKLY